MFEKFSQVLMRHVDEEVKGTAAAAAAAALIAKIGLLPRQEFFLKSACLLLRLPLQPPPPPHPAPHVLEQAGSSLCGFEVHYYNRYTLYQSCTITTVLLQYGTQ